MGQYVNPKLKTPITLTVSEGFLRWIDSWIVDQDTYYEEFSDDHEAVDTALGREPYNEEDDDPEWWKSS